MDYQRLLDLTEKVLIVRGSAGSGNYGHDGRPGKKGGSGKGGGLRRIGAKKDTPAGDRKKAAKEFGEKRKKVFATAQAAEWIKAQKNLKYDLHGAAGVRDINSTMDVIRNVVTKNPNIDFDLTGIHIENVKPTLEQFGKLAEEWPEVAGRIKYLGTDPADKIWEQNFSYANSRPSGQIGLNPAHYKDKDFRDSLSLNKKSGWLVGNDLGSVITHEFGHQVNYHFNGMGDQAITKVSAEDGFGVIPDTLRLFSRRNKPTNQLSNYATQNDSEAFAEGFTALYHGTKRQKDTPFVRSFSVLLNELADKSKRVSIFDRITPSNRYKFSDAEIKDAVENERLLRQRLNM